MWPPFAFNHKLHWPPETMQTVMVIPTYWSRDSSIGWQPGDAIYDHPTPIDQNGTLARALESINLLTDTDFTLVLLASSTTPDIEGEVEERVKSIAREASPPVDTYVISHSHLRSFHQELKAIGREDLVNVLSLTGYSNVRNMCIFIPYVLGAEIAILIDDDEYFDDSHFVTKAREFIGGRFMGQTIDGVAGYYVNASGTYYDDVPEEIHWMTYWDRFGSKREAFDQVIPGKPRLKRTPFAFGGCMVIHRSLFRTVPFDPGITRGEDTDYVLNARMFGFDFFLDNQLSIQHRPPPKSHPTWRRFREDIHRLLYSRAKLQGQTPQINMDIITAEDLDPYPGEFLKETLDDKILKTNLILALDYLTEDRVEDTKETIRNIWLARTKAIPKFNPFEHYLNIQRQWRALRKVVSRVLHDSFYYIIQRGDIYYEEEEILKMAQRAEFEKNAKSLKTLPTDGIPLFESLTPEHEKMLLSISQKEFFAKDDIIIKDGSDEHKLYIIIKGRARIILRSDDKDEETVLAEVGEGEMLGEVSLVINAPHSATVAAKEPTEVITIERSDLFDLMEKSPELAAKIWHRLAMAVGNRLRDTNFRYLSSTRDGFDDIADFMLGTGPLTGEETGD
ncbi:MAG: cyclic nucleotide-binding domain-containing protein [Anaerolineales bacterium]|nr:cyclic nucleotide-binding domain-containing protein [Anaerolineales bacterium]